ncbi:MAG: hypothetical protein PHU23_11720 [Dehalococcoidales bacterium]|nr:hypothetical protein [Dehalococcoidales bacterium]
MAFDSKMKPDHAGAKNGGGYYGYRSEAKENSKVARRKQAKKEIKRQLEEIDG